MWDTSIAHVWVSDKWSHPSIKLVLITMWKRRRMNNLTTHNVASKQWCLDFSFVFSAPLPAWRNLFSASGIFFSGGRLPASLSLFLKSEKIPALLYVGKGPEYRPFSYPSCFSIHHLCWISNCYCEVVGWP